MAMKPRSRVSRLWLGLGGMLLVLLLAAVFTFGSLRIPFEPHQWNELVILYALSTLIVAALLVLGLVLGRTLLHLWAERRAEQLGSRFRTKMVLGAMAVSLLPLVFLFFISYALMNRTLNRWFPRPLEEASAETQTLLREVNRTDYVRLSEIAQRAARAASSQSLATPAALQATAVRLASAQGAEGVWFVASSGAVLPSVGDPLNSPVQIDSTLAFARELPSGAELWTSRSGSYLAARAPLGQGYLVVAHRLPADFLARSNAIAAQMDAYQVQNRQIRTFKRQILLTLSLLTLLLVFSATWFALYLSKQVTVPIQALAEATEEITSGHFDTQVHVRAQDELGSLVRLFNKMTAQLSDSRRQIDDFTRHLQEAVQELDRRRALIETVLENIPTGVLSLDAEGRIQRTNTAARQIFGDAAREGGTLPSLAGNDMARDVQRLIRRSLRMSTASKELTFRLAGRVVHAAVTVSPLGPRRSNAGFVVVVDDLTELLRAQKAAAWQEVAQRIAHEIKNPLTPIQLSAERLLRYLDRHAQDTASPALERLVNECATLIGREVGTLEALVNEFSQFARFPIARLSPADPNEIVRGALEVFQGRLDGVSIHTRFADELPPIRADAELLRRVVVNLIDNAAEAMEGSPVKYLELSTRFHTSRDVVEIVIADSGRGISAEDKDKLFLPHFSTKDRGTGLGLAIASRVIAEHHGLIRAEDNTPAGARFLIELPAAEPTPAALPAWKS
jgi:two-component system, NtrC family, nitrogen regulation sensor histidine kinase NtrY